MPQASVPSSNSGLLGPGLARRLLCLAAAGTSSLVLAGCSAELNSLVGLTVDDERRITAAVAVCEGVVDGLVLYDESDSPDEPKVIQRWTVEAGAGLTLIPLATDGSQALATQLGIVDEDEVSIAGYGGELNGANRWFGPGPYFTALDLAGLRPGEVLWESDTLERTDTVAFEEAACAYKSARA